MYILRRPQTFAKSPTFALSTHSKVHTDKSKVEISQNSVAFSEYMNFNARRGSSLIPLPEMNPKELNQKLALKKARQIAKGTKNITSKPLIFFQDSGTARPIQRKLTSQLQSETESAEDKAKHTEHLELSAELTKLLLPVLLEVRLLIIFFFTFWLLLAFFDDFWI